MALHAQALPRRGTKLCQSSSILRPLILNLGTCSWRMRVLHWTCIAPTRSSGRTPSRPGNGLAPFRLAPIRGAIRESITVLAIAGKRLRQRRAFPCHELTFFDLHSCLDLYPPQTRCHLALFLEPQLPIHSAKILA